MSNYHILTLSNSEARASVVYHFSVPNENNDAGVNIRDAIRMHLEYQAEDGIITTRIPWDIGLELAEIQSGSLYEHCETYEFSNAHDTLLAKRSELDSKYVSLDTKFQNKLRVIFGFWGLNRDIP